MKNPALILALTVAAHCYAGPAHADFDYDKMWNKFKRGAINVVSSPLEIPKQIKTEIRESDDESFVKTFSAIGGTVKGLGYTVGRLGSGVWDLVTFNLPIPGNYDSLMKPEYVCECNKK